MVICPVDHSLQADVIFVVESTAINGAYINDLKSNYIVPALEYFSQGNIDDSNNSSENSNSFYGIVTYQAADCLPRSSSDTIGPFYSPAKVLAAIDKLELIGGKGESHANIAEGLATTLQCFEELQQNRDIANVQKHCILICNSPPYLLPVFESQMYVGKTAEQLAALLQEKNINLSIISPRKIPSLYKLFEKAGGDLTASQTKNYAKDPRHLVLLRGFSLKERPLSPPPGGNLPQQTPSMPSPLADSPSNTVTTAPNYRPTTTVTASQQVGMARNSNAMMGQQPPPGYHNATNLQQNRPPSRWPMLPPPQTQQQRPYMQQSTTTASSQGSALIAQLTQPPSALAGGVNQFGQLNMQQQQQQMKINLIQQNQQPNVQTTQQPTSMAQISQQQNQAVTSQAQQGQATNQQLNTGRERHNIWQGLLEWIEKPKNPTDQQKITKHVPCQVSANSKDGEPELKADNWPPKLIMQLMPKQLIGSIGGAYLKNSKSVLFHPQQCEALDSLTKVMSAGFAGCVHFTSNTPNCASCDIKVLILLYTVDKRAYLGFIPNDQGAFVDRLRKVIQQQKSTQMMRQTQSNPPLGGGNGSGGNGTPPQQLQNPVTSQQSQQGLMMAQTNTMAIGAGGQITQNVAANQPGAALLGQAGQMQPRLRMQGIQQAGPNQGMQPNLMSGGPSQAPPPQPQQPQTGQQRGPFENQLQVERQQNLEKINQLKQTLEAAQQQEQQYKSQLERISHMKTAQLQEALQIAQQTEMQYKMLDQQRMANQGNAQAANAQPQQRMMRPVMGGNPGLRHLLQQQPQYRQQMMGMQQQMGGNGPRQQQLPNTGNQQQNAFDDVPYDFM